METNGTRGASVPASTYHKTNNTEASSIASSEQSLVSASGYKFKRGDKKAGRLKLKKLPVQVKKEKQTNGAPPLLRQ